MRHIHRRHFLGGFAAGTALLAGSNVVLAQPVGGTGRIDVHHHFASPFWKRTADGMAPAMMGIWNPWTPAKSIATMDDGGCQKAILSVTSPGISFGDNAQSQRLARDSNDYAAKMRSDFPGRFGIFAALPFPDVDASLKEIAYGLDTLKADGVGLFTSYGKYYLGDPIFDPIFEELNRRKAVLFVHPTSAACCAGLLQPQITDADIEYGTETTRAIAHLIMSGKTIKYPNVKIIWSHAGGTMPYLQWRWSRETYKMPKYPDGRQPTFAQEAARMYYDIAQSAVAAPMSAITKMIPVDHLLFGTDYPYNQVKDLVDGLANCGVFSADQLAQIGRGNAIALFGHA